LFAVPSLEILGHTISATGAASTANHAAEIKNCPPPQDIKQLQRFLVMVNFYRRFLSKCAQILKPLTDLLKGGAKTLEWTVSAQEAFQNAKRLLVAAAPLQHPASNAELSLATDASDTRKLTDTESRYSTFDCELLAAHAAIKHFLHFCEGRAPFQLWTDLKPLVTAISRVSASIWMHTTVFSGFSPSTISLRSETMSATDESEMRKPGTVESTTLRLADSR
jgi:hypothetical protein